MKVLVQHQFRIREELRRATAKIDASAARDRARAAVKAIEERVLDDAHLAHRGTEDFLEPRVQGRR